MFLSDTEKKKMYDEMCMLGLDEEFVKSKNIENIYMANQVINGYYLDQIISNDDRMGLIYAILNNKVLGEKKSYLSNVIQDFETMGFDKKTISGMIIKMAINETIIDGGYTYSQILNNSNARFDMEACKDEVKQKAKVTAGDVVKAKSIALNEQQIMETIERVNALGIDNDFLSKHDVRNIYVAEQIVDRYVYSRNLTNEEKKALIYGILNTKSLQHRGVYLSSIILNLENLENDEQKVYETLIKFGIDGRIGSCSYSKVIGNPNGCSEMLRESWDETRDDIRISEEDLMKAKSQLVSVKCNVNGEEIVRATMGLLRKDSNGSKLCDDVEKDYTYLIEQKNSKTYEEEGRHDISN